MDNIENIKSSDYDQVISNLNNWWGGRQMVPMLPRLFFNHFSKTSFIIKEKEKVIGFIIGFLSQTDAKKAYVHFAGIHPDFRNRGIGRKLYLNFFKVIIGMGVTEVECATSPGNKVSIKFHEKIGFIPKPGNDRNEEGTPFTRNYDGPGENRVIFTIQFPQAAISNN